MAVSHTIYECGKCGSQSPKWAGRCFECGAWNTLVAGVESTSAAVTVGRLGQTNGTGLGTSAGTAVATESLAKITTDNVRTATGDDELDRVLGGGLVTGSVVLLSGAPGLGKSTLLLQTLSVMKKPALYVSAEESLAQVKLRANRLTAALDTVRFISDCNVANVRATVAKEKPTVVVVDSVHTLFHPDVAGVAGGIVQVNAVAAELIAMAKELGITVVLVGHVTKSGFVAGPKTLEHAVDVVLHLEGEKGSPLRVVRASKNRFGATGESGVYVMRDTGLRALTEADMMAVSEAEAEPGIVHTITHEGVRYLPTEVQALVSETSYSNPRRAAAGIDMSRLSLVVAMLQRHARIDLRTADVYINVQGAVKLRAPEADLAIALAIASAATQKKLAPKTVVLGELSLSGKVVTGGAVVEAMKAAKRLGYVNCVVGAKAPSSKTMKVQKVSSLTEAMRILV